MLSSSNVLKDGLVSLFLFFRADSLRFMFGGELYAKVEASIVVIHLGQSKAVIVADGV